MKSKFTFDAELSVLAEDVDFVSHLSGGLDESVDFSSEPDSIDKEDWQKITVVESNTSGTSFGEVVGSQELGEEEESRSQDLREMDSGLRSHRVVDALVGKDSESKVESCCITLKQGVKIIEISRGLKRCDFNFYVNFFLLCNEITGNSRNENSTP